MTTYHLYSDGNYFPRAKKSGFGGYIEDPTGQVVVEYSEQIKQTQYAHNFELLGIIRGLQIAKDRGIDNIVSHCDDKNTASRLKEIFEENINKVTPQAKPELYDIIIEMAKYFKKIKFEYIPRSQNKYADSLSRRYANLMEDNFLRHYDEELISSERKFVQNAKASKRIFFSHPSFIKNPHKSNPYLVAQNRNKKIRKISRIEEKKDYQYIYIENFIKEQKNICRTFIYDKQYKLKKIDESQFSLDSPSLENFCSNLDVTLKNMDCEKVWIYSNQRKINAYFEQKDKIPNDQFDTFQTVFNSFNQFTDVFFHTLPFKHQFSPEIEIKETKKQTLDNNIESVEQIMEQLSHGILGKEQNKCFGNLIRYQLRSYKNHLERELNDFEKSDIIEKTSAHLTQLGFKGLPKVKNKN